ncbi:hypothetical protein LTR53_006521, partial [Teratosphaeriaceae sp. CCFEE 6253]
MASARVYRDFTAEEDPLVAPPRRSPSLRGGRQSPTASRRPVIPDLRTSSRPSRFRDDGIPEMPAERDEQPARSYLDVPIGTAQTTPDERTTALPTYGARLAQVQTASSSRVVGFPAMSAGIAQSRTESRRSSFGGDGTITSTSNDDGTSTTSYGDDELAEPVLDPEQMGIPPMSPRAVLESRPSYASPKRHGAPSVTSATDSLQPRAQDPRASGRGSTTTTPARMPEFFGQAVFQTVLQNPTIAHQLLAFAQSRLCGENMEFLARVARYAALLEEVSRAVYEIHKDFISTSAPAQINLPEHLLVQVNGAMKTSLTSTLPLLESVFVAAQADIERLVYTDIYPHFVRHQMGVSAARALGSDKSQYAGLGDCFVLTDPAKADNPILYATDGFVKVTGYARNEIIPRNCRFLQSRHADRAAVRRLKAAIDARQESVELLLNVKKNGEPFWNLLYVAPLYDAHGRLAFFLGGQINCSTAVHSASDVLRILGSSNEKAEDNVHTSTTSLPSPPPPQPPKAPRARSFLNALRGAGPRAAVQALPSPGMEDRLLGRLGEQSLRGQKDMFYSAYSN